jgi:hydrogenase maturation protein HypF
MGDLAPLRALTQSERRLIDRMLRSGVNSPITTSAGRLFDGIAALIDLHQQVSFEGQAAMALEFAADEAESGAYPLPISGSGAVQDSTTALVVDWIPLVRGIVTDLRHGVGAHIIAARFHNSLVNGIVGVALRAGQSRVALSGGCFQNRRLTERAASGLREAGFEVLLHRQVPPNDGGISLGQIAVAAARLKTQGGLEK